MIKLTIQEKDAIRDMLDAYVERYPSANKAVASLKGTSTGTVSSIRSSKYDDISDNMFRKIASQVGGTPQKEGWQICETGAFNDMTFAMADAQQWKNVTWIVGDAGCGKTATANIYASEHKDVFVILCSEDMKRSDFVREMANKIGISTDGYKIRKILDLILDAVIKMDSPLLIFDEADKLTDNVFNYFISIYNKLEDKDNGEMRAGIILQSTSYIKRRMESGLKNNKKGYHEIYSRIGRKFFEVEPTTGHDIYAICVENGLTDQREIDRLIKETEEYMFDLRRVKKAIHVAKRKAAAVQK